MLSVFGWRGSRAGRIPTRSSKTFHLWWVMTTGREGSRVWHKSASFALVVNFREDCRLFALRCSSDSITHNDTKCRFCHHLESVQSFSLELVNYPNPPPIYAPTRIDVIRVATIRVMSIPLTPGISQAARENPQRNLLLRPYNSSKWQEHLLAAIYSRRFTLALKWGRGRNSTLK